MRKKITTAQATAIGTRLKAARLRANLSITQLGCATGVHHSQVSRCERGDFKTYGKNVQKLCFFLSITYPGITDTARELSTLTERFEALLKALPGSAQAFSHLFDVLEGSAAVGISRRRQPSTGPR